MAGNRITQSEIASVLWPNNRLNRNEIFEQMQINGSAVGDVAVVSRELSNMINAAYIIRKSIPGQNASVWQLTTAGKFEFKDYCERHAKQTPQEINPDAPADDDAEEAMDQLDAAINQLIDEAAERATEEPAFDETAYKQAAFDALSNDPNFIVLDATNPKFQPILMAFSGIHKMAAELSEGMVKPINIENAAGKLELLNALIFSGMLSERIREQLSAIKDDYEGFCNVQQ